MFVLKLDILYPLEEIQEKNHQIFEHNNSHP